MNTTLALMMMFSALTPQDLPPTQVAAAVEPSTPTKASPGVVVAEPDPQEPEPQDVGCSAVRALLPNVPTPGGNPPPNTGWVNPRVSC
jgi:hypothetical protein